MTREEYDQKLGDIHMDEQGCEDAFYQYEIASIDYIRSLEQRITELEYNFSCVLDNATGGKASKPNIDLDIAYKLIADNTNFWVESAIAELGSQLKVGMNANTALAEQLVELEALRTCEGCIYKSTMNNWCIKFDIKVHDGFCCNSYEPKEEARP